MSTILPLPPLDPPPLPRRSVAGDIDVYSKSPLTQDCTWMEEVTYHISWTPPYLACLLHYVMLTTLCDSHANVTMT